MNGVCAAHDRTSFVTTASRLRFGLGFALVWIFVAALFGAVPFVSTPTLGQAVWISGFAKSLALQSPLSLYASHFGLPHPAAISFGLPGAVVQSWFIRLGIDTLNAYSFMFAWWLGVALAGGVLFCRRHQVPLLLALLLATVWLCSPIVWGHTGYSMLAIGFALLPTYLWCAHVSFERVAANAWLALSILCMACLCAVFTDGYTFVMFAVASAILIPSTVPSDVKSRCKALAVLVGAAGLAFVAYSSFQGWASFSPSPIGFFRGWGADLATIVVPSRHIFWFWDAIGLSVTRDASSYFGDDSSWHTPFATPLLLAAAVSFISLTRGNKKSALPWLAMAAVGTYLSFGPSFKVMSIRSATEQAAGVQTQEMAPEQAVAPTGTAFLSTYVPGFKAMRAAYRWMGLGCLGLWCLVMQAFAAMRRPRATVIAAAGATAMLVAQLPKDFGSTDIPWFVGGIESQNELPRLREVALEFSASVRPNDKIALVPQGNDWLAGYLCAEAQARCYNIGGDKNVEVARAQWPASIQALFQQNPTTSQGEAVVDALLFGDADRVVLSSVDLFVDACFGAPTDLTLRARQQQPSTLWTLNEPLLPTVVALEERPHLFSTMLNSLQHHPLVDTSVGHRFTTLALKPEVLALDLRQRKRLSPWFEPQSVEQVRRVDGLDARFLVSGWYPRESDHVWSNAHSRLRLVRDDVCAAEPCELHLVVRSFAANPTRPVRVVLSSESTHPQTLVLTNDDWQTIALDLKPRGGSEDEVLVDIQVTGARSPASMGASADGRVLGLALQSLSLHRASK